MPPEVSSPRIASKYDFVRLTDGEDEEFRLRRMEAEVSEMDEAQQVTHHGVLLSSGQGPRWPCHAPRVHQRHHQIESVLHSLKCVATGIVIQFYCDFIYFKSHCFKH